MQREKKVFIYHPNILGVRLGDDGFAGVLNHLCSSQNGIFSIDPDEQCSSRVILHIEHDGGNYAISLQKLKEEDLPKIANASDGSNEVDLAMPDGTALSFKNLFIYNHEKGILVSAKLGSCPQIGMLRKCLQKIIRNEIPGFERAIFITPMVFERGLVDKLRGAVSISMAQFSSQDFYGEEISGTRLDQYKEYLSGQGYAKTTKLKGLMGQNLKAQLAPIIDDIIANGGTLPEHIKIKMEIDGDSVDFSKYYKMYKIMVKVSETNHRYLDYNNLKLKLLQIVAEFNLTHEE